MPQILISAKVPDLSADLRKSTEHLKQAISGQVDDWVGRSRHALRRGRQAAEDLAEGSARTVKKYPLSSVTGGLLIGFMMGGFIGWCIGRRH